MTWSATLRTRPIMPDFALHAMQDDDRRAIYRFIRSLGNGRRRHLEYLPPGSAPPALLFFQLVAAAGVAPPTRRGRLNAAPTHASADVSGTGTTRRRSTAPWRC